MYAIVFCCMLLSVALHSSRGERNAPVTLHETDHDLHQLIDLQNGASPSEDGTVGPNAEDKFKNKPEGEYAYSLGNQYNFRLKRQEVTNTSEETSPASPQTNEPETDSSDTDSPTTTEKPESEKLQKGMDEKLKWVTYLLLFTIIILIILLLIVIIFLVYFIFTSKNNVKGPLCKEIEIQCNCPECTNDNNRNDDNDCA